MKHLCLFLLLFSLSTVSFGTHNRAGQLLFTHITGDTYEFTHTQFYYTPSMAWRDRTFLTISFGDGSPVGRIPRVNLRTPSGECESLPDNFTRCVYRVRHTFPGPGVYTLVVEDPNRNLGVENIPNSVAVVFSVKTTLRIDPNTGSNNAPVIERNPTDKAAVGRLFVHNPGATHERDSLSYALVVCKRERGVEIETYTFPAASNEPYQIYVVTDYDNEPFRPGDLVWDTPMKAGIYNVAMRIDQWHHRHRNIRVGSIVRDMQIEVVETDNLPPIIEPIEDICVIAGEEITVEIVATDPDNDRIKITATGYPFREDIINPAENLRIDVDEPGRSVATFKWQTHTSHVRQQAYTVHVKAEDVNSHVALAAFSQFNITVIAPPVESVIATPDKKVIRLEWKPSPVEHAAGYEIWRRICNPEADNSCDELILEHCITGIPAGYGYELVGVVTRPPAEGNIIPPLQTWYNDNNNGRGLSPGINYCYRIVTTFVDRARSLPSIEDVCEMLEPGSPPLIRASVENIGIAGKIHVEWLEEPFLDKLLKEPENYKYRLFFSTDSNVIWNDSPSLWTHLRDFNLVAADDGATSFTHENIDTKDVFPYYYKVLLTDRENIIVDEPDLPEENEIASSLYPILTPTDQSVHINFGRYAPWVNNAYDIYRCISDGNGNCLQTGSPPPDLPLFVKINDEPVVRELFIDRGLDNGQEYCYIVRSAGYRSLYGIRYENENWSHISCTTPEDNIAPCTPDLFGETICQLTTTQIYWNYEINCEDNEADDMEKFLVYYADYHRNFNRDVYTHIATVERDDPFREGNKYYFNHAGALMGCYYIVAVDAVGNHSEPSNFVCLDDENCDPEDFEGYRIPNVFTPNADGINDFLVAHIAGLCECDPHNAQRNCLEHSNVVFEVDMQIFNRAGKLVYQTKEPCINWNGRDMDTGRFVASGAYFYTCDVHRIMPGGNISIITKSGVIHVYSDGDGVGGRY